MALIARLARPGGALSLSIALNLFLAGALAGLWIGGDASPPRAGNGVEYSLAEFIRDLPAESRRRMVDAFDDSGAEVVRRIGALTRARARVTGALGAEPYDPASVRRAFAALRRSTRDVQVSMHGIVGQVTDELSPRDRARLARSMFAAMPGTGGEEIGPRDVPLL